MLLITSLGINFCWDWANHSNPTLWTSVTVRTTKRIYWWHLKWPKNNLPSQNHSLQIGGDPLNRLLYLISFVKTASQRALRSKRTGLSLCGLSGCAIAPRVLRLMNVCTSLNKDLQPWLKKPYCSGFRNYLWKLGKVMGVSIRLTVCIKSAVGWAGLWNQPTGWISTCLTAPSSLSSEILVYMKSIFLLWYCFCCFVLMHCCMYRFSKMKLMTQPQVSTWFYIPNYLQKIKAYYAYHSLNCILYTDFFSIVRWQEQYYTYIRNVWWLQLWCNYITTQ